jgi:uroporphyrinogen III methyltransferase / synthase
MTHDAPVGIVHLIGAGPGDPGLITVRGRDLLERCDAVVCDARANVNLLAHVPTSAERYDVGERERECEGTPPDAIISLLDRLVRAGRRVARLVPGDPFVFGSGSDEARAMAAAGVPFEVVPGVTAAIAAAVYAGIPVAHPGLATSVTLVADPESTPGGVPRLDWQALARTGGSLVLYARSSALPRIAEALEGGGMAPDTPAAFIQSATLPGQRTIMATVATLGARAADANLAGPGITIIGPVVSMREEIAWLERRPLFGMRVIVTRARAGAAALSAKLVELGADVLEMPVTRIVPLDQDKSMAAISRLREYDWLVFTSQNGVDQFWRALRAADGDARTLADIKVAAVGPATSDSLARVGVVVDVIPERFIAEGLLAAMSARDDIRGRRILYVAARETRDVLPKGLRALGATVDLLTLYESVPDAEGAEAMRERLMRDEADIVTFTSASAVRAFADAVGADAVVRARLVSMGAATSDAIRSAGLAVHAEAEPSTLDGLVRAVISSRR